MVTEDEVDVLQRLARMEEIIASQSRHIANQDQRINELMLDRKNAFTWGIILLGGGFISLLTYVAITIGRP